MVNRIPDRITNAAAFRAYWRDRHIGELLAQHAQDMSKHTGEFAQASAQARLAAATWRKAWEEHDYNTGDPADK